jgi:hypothetical protein
MEARSLFHPGKQSPKNMVSPVRQAAILLVSSQFYQGPLKSVTCFSPGWFTCQVHSPEYSHYKYVFPRFIRMSSAFSTEYSHYKWNIEPTEVELVDGSLSLTAHPGKSLKLATWLFCKELVEILVFVLAGTSPGRIWLLNSRDLTKVEDPKIIIIISIINFLGAGIERILSMVIHWQFQLNRIWNSNYLTLFFIIIFVL